MLDDRGRAGDDRRVADRQRQARRPGAEDAGLVDELEVRRDRPLGEVDRDVRQPDADEADVLAGELARRGDDHHLGLAEGGAASRHRRASNSSIGVAVGVLDEDLLAARPGDDRVPERRRRPRADRSTLAARSSTSRTNRFQPPGSGWRPSGIGRAAELAGPLSHRIEIAATGRGRTPRPSARRCSNPRSVAVERDRPVDVGDDDSGRSAISGTPRSRPSRTAREPGRSEATRSAPSFSR